MGSFRGLGRPRWIVAGLLLAGFTVLCFTVLAPWQLAKSAATDDRNHQVSSATEAGPIPIEQLQESGSSFDRRHEWREVTITGAYLTDHEVTVRRRSAGGRTEVVTPFRESASGRIVLVDRGRLTPDTQRTAAPSGELTIRGRLRAPENSGRYDTPRVADGELIAYTLDPEALGTATTLTVAPFYVQLSGPQPGALDEIPLPAGDGIPHRSYGFQWIALGILVPLASGYFVYAETRRRRSDGPAPVVRTDTQRGRPTTT